MNREAFENVERCNLSKVNARSLKVVQWLKYGIFKDNQNVGLILLYMCGFISDKSSVSRNLPEYPARITYSIRRTLPHSIKLWTT